MKVSKVRSKYKIGSLVFVDLGGICGYAKIINIAYTKIGTPMAYLIRFYKETKSIWVGWDSLSNLYSERNVK